jgi:hypothetical protein
MICATWRICNPAPCDMGQSQVASYAQGEVNWYQA